MTHPANITHILGRLAAARAQLTHLAAPAPDLHHLIHHDLPQLLDEIVLQRSALLDVYDTATTLYRDLTATLNDQDQEKR